MNINDNVIVELTDLGRQIARAKNARHMGSKKGRSIFQLWHLMEIFGPHMYHGCPQLFVNNIIEIENK